MHLWAHTDASYLSEPKARSRAGGYYFLSDKPKLPIRANDPPPPLNRAISVKSKIIDAVMSSAQEAETGAGFYNAKEIIPLRQALEELGHPQGPTPIQFDNISATQIKKEEASQKRSKSMDMRYYWLRDRAKQQQFNIYWKSGTQNLADYFTKHHSPRVHKILRHDYILKGFYTHQNKNCLTPAQTCKGVLKYIGLCQTGTFLLLAPCMYRISTNNT